ncbi:conserved hypothetical protein [Ricinus communis]|uniref:Uncharacterized protein n=1 Tax=Ricinus communis TaxID=3988 RepID=B9RAX1_RICCO|nr:conserved hypothetical protein [Ricinus communis]
MSKLQTSYSFQVILVLQKTKLAHLIICQVGARRTLQVTGRIRKRILASSADHHAAPLPFGVATTLAGSDRHTRKGTRRSRARLAAIGKSSQEFAARSCEFLKH